jgi:hypothetical protein
VLKRIEISRVIGIRVAASFFIFLQGFLVQPAFAEEKPALCVVQGEVAGHPLYQDLMTRWQRLLVRRSFAASYRQVHWEESDSPLQSPEVDLLILGQPAETQRGCLNEIRAGRTRVGFLMVAAQSDSSSSWDRFVGGAQQRLSLVAPESWVGSFLPRFAKVRSAPLGSAEAVKSAARIADLEFAQLWPFLSDEERSMVPRWELVTQVGHWEEQSERVTPIAEVSQAQMGGSPFSNFATQLVTSLFPSSHFDLSRIPNVQVLLERVGWVAWAQLRDVFGNSVPGKDAVWLGGDELREVLKPFERWLGSNPSLILKEIQGAQFQRTADGFSVNLIFKQSLVIPLVPQGEKPKTGQLERAWIPKEVHFWLALRGDRLILGGLDQRGHRIEVKPRLPGFLGRANLREIRLNLTTGGLRAEAGFGANLVGLVARGALTAGKFDGLSIWETLEANLPLLLFPLLLFGI